MKYSDQSKALLKLLNQDQAEWKAYARAELVNKLPDKELQHLKKLLRKRVTERGDRALRILKEIDDMPSLNNIGSDSAVALSVLATHYSLSATKQVLAAFENCYQKSPKDTQITSIPAMTDWVAVLEHRPQKFGTIWLFDSNNYPFLPPVEDFATVNERRIKYGIEPLSWPKSMVIPEESQPWLKLSITESVMRTPTKEELKILEEFY